MEIDQVEYIADVGIAEFGYEGVSWIGRHGAVERNVLHIVAHIEMADIDYAVFITYLLGLYGPEAVAHLKVRRGHGYAEGCFALGGVIETGVGGYLAPEDALALVVPRKGGGELIVATYEVEPQTHGYAILHIHGNEVGVERVVGCEEVHRGIM